MSLLNYSKDTLCVGRKYLQAVRPWNKKKMSPVQYWMLIHLYVMDLIQKQRRNDFQQLHSLPINCSCYCKIHTKNSCIIYNISICQEKQQMGSFSAKKGPCYRKLETIFARGFQMENIPFSDVHFQMQLLRQISEDLRKIQNTSFKVQLKNASNELLLAGVCTNKIRKLCKFRSLKTRT